jgi:hypothetical protein
MTYTSVREADSQGYDNMKTEKATPLKGQPVYTVVIYQVKT